MNLIQKILKTIFLFFVLISLSCEENTDTQPQPVKFLGGKGLLFNLPFNQDTFLIDKENNIDFRIEIQGHEFVSAVLTIDNNHTLELDKPIISTKRLFLSEGLHNIAFIIRAIKLESGDLVTLTSRPLMFNVVERLADRFVHPTVLDGKLKLTWQEFDKENTRKYLVERWWIDYRFFIDSKRKKYYQAFEVEEASFVDDYYVGEEAEYKITILNKEGDKQDILYYKKPQEHPNYHVTQNALGGYNFHFSKSNYINNFGQYYLLDYVNGNPIFINSSSQVNDTVFHIEDVNFGNEARFSLQYLPKRFPEGFIDDDSEIYGNFIYTRYGEKSFEYDRLAVIDNKNVAFTANGNIYKINLESNQITDSIINENGRYEGFLRATTAGDFIYIIDNKISGSPLLFWPSNNFSTEPKYIFQISNIIPPVSDNLVTVKSVSNNSPSRLAIYDVTNSNRIFTTDFNGLSSKISSNGQYFFIDDSDLRLCSYENDSFKVIWEETDWLKRYPFYDFSPLSNEVCYLWDGDKKFSIRNTFDFSEINSFTLELEKIINIDYSNKKIMGYVMDKILIYNLDNGTLEKEIPSNLTNLFLFDNNSVIIGNTIYNNNGIKYVIHQ